MKTHKELGITKFQHRNIAKLTLWARNNDGKVAFNIERFHIIKKENEEYEEEGNFDGLVIDVLKVADEKNVCGTSACFCGYGPSAGIKGHYKEQWGDYGRRAFGAYYVYNGRASNESEHDIFDWLFDGNHLNTLKSAYFRAAYFLEHGLPNKKLDLTELEVEEIDASFIPNWQEIEKIANLKK